MKIRLVVCDVDGVLTDGRLYYDRRGECMKVFHTRDGVAVGMLRDRGIRVGVLTAKKNGIAEARARALGMEVVGAGARDKLKALRRYARMPLAHVAYLGDDVIDVEVMRAVGLAVAPRDAAREARAAADWITKARGGEGVLREVAERLLSAAGPQPKGGPAAKSKIPNPKSQKHPKSQIPTRQGRSQRGALPMNPESQRPGLRDRFALFRRPRLRISAPRDDSQP